MNIFQLHNIKNSMQYDDLNLVRIFTDHVLVTTSSTNQAGQCDYVSRLSRAID